MNIVVALLLYPGVLTALLLGVAWRWRLGDREISGWRSAMASSEGRLALLSLLLVGVSLAWVPWPWHPAPTLMQAGGWWMSWMALEAAFLLPLMPALLSGAPLALRAAQRELQIGVAGRLLVWLMIGTLWWLASNWEPAIVPGRLLLFGIGVLALPAALGLANFGNERAITPSGINNGLDEGSAALVRLAQAVAGAGLIAQLAVALFGQAAIDPMMQLVMIGLMIAGFIALGPRLLADRPRLTTQMALRWCVGRLLPFALALIAVLAWFAPTLIARSSN